MNSDSFSRRSARVRAAFSLILLCTLVLLAGCSGGSSVKYPSLSPVNVAALNGDVYGGLQPVAGATVVAYAAATTAGAVPTELGADVTSSSGKFNITFSPSPATDEVIYATVTGGNAGGGTNTAIGLMTIAGVQGSTLAPAAGTVTINELTTVAATAALKKYIAFADCSTITGNSQTGTCLSIAGATGLRGNAATVNRLVDVETGQASAFLTDNSSTAGAPLTATLTKLNTLASVIAACVDSNGTTSACTDLFQTTSGQSNTLMSAWLVARMPAVTQKARALYDLTPATPTFSPVLATVPGTTSTGFWTVGGERYAFTANYLSNDISGFLQTHGGGALTPIAGSPFAAGTLPSSVAVDPMGRYVYVADGGGGNTGTVSAYRLDADGTLTPIAGSPFAAGNTPTSVAVDPTGRYVYVTNTFGNNVSAYTIGAGGALTPVAGSPFAAGTYPNSVAVDPTGHYVYVANYSTNNGSISAYTIGAGGALTPVAGSPFVAGSLLESVVVDPTGRYVYVANAGGGGILAYTVGTGGALTPVAGSPFDASTIPYAVTVDPTGRYVYAVNGGSSNSTVSAYTIGAGGALTVVAGSPFAAGANPFSVSVDPTGRYVYVANSGGINSSNGNISAYTIGAGGVLTPLAGSPFAAGANPMSVSADPTGRYVFVANSGAVGSQSGTVSAYMLGGGGVLTPVAGSPFAAGTEPYSVTADPTGRYVYVANTNSNNLSAYTLGAGGTLTPLAGSPFAVGTYPQSVTVDPTGRYVYVASGGGNNVSAYTLGTDGALTPLAGSPFAAGTNPYSVAVDPTGRYVYVANDGVPPANNGNVSAYTIGAGGALTAVAGSPFAAGTNPSSAAVDPTGHYVYVANVNSNNVSAYTIGAGGVLTPIAGSPFAAGTNPTSVAVDPTGRYVYVANSSSNGTVSAYAIGAGGALSPIAGSPFAAGAYLHSVAVDPTGRYVYVVSSGDPNSKIGTVLAYSIGAGGALTPLADPSFATGTYPISIVIAP